MKKIILLLICFVFFFSTGYAKVDLSLIHEIEHSIKIGLQWLVTQQEENGSWQHYPAITALALISILNSNPNISYEFEPVDKGLGFLASCAKPNGAIYTDNMPNYNTSICLMAFKEANDPEYADIIDRAEKYLLNLQIDEEEGYSADSLYYGGVGYGGDQRPDLSNLQWALEAMLEREPITFDAPKINKKEITNLDEKKAFFEKAIVFLQRCQNLEDYNPEPYSGNDGGFMYEPGKSKAGGSTSYGNMTYAGLKSMIYAKLEKDDPRVQAAYNWISNNFIVETNPVLGNQGLFYYYLMMAKALTAYDADIIVGDDGVRHDWRKELANQLIKIQNEEGWWQNENGRWWENNKVLVTTYCIISLEEILKDNT
ncbi:MAG TPA: hypothetical protein ENG70_04265 [Candidatus Cloacimonetes bacterium]|nr:hypothetical protein [Candidatus Cloacimonadota bacterium]HEX38058.1 hypothetical protein [Candidatus Cloacimonadota bacterium]